MAGHDEEHDDEGLRDSEMPDEADVDADEEGQTFSVETEPCPYCGKPVYEQAEVCPHCKSFLSIEEGRGAGRPKWMVIAALLVIAAIVIGWVLAKSGVHRH
jgi:predicted nucleic acid-binding Zn ribbon protein